MNSDIWIPDINNLCANFFETLQKQPGGRFIVFQGNIGTEQKPGKVVEEYHKSVEKLKKEIFGENADQSHIDRHKIAALYIRSFLIHKPLLLNIPKEEKNVKLCLLTKLPNEYLSMLLLTAIFRAWNNDFDGKLRMDPSYKGNFIKLLYHYEKNINSLDPLSLSNTIYLIEQRYFIRSK
jgi:hypothetical protein